MTQTATLDTRRKFGRPPRELNALPVNEHPLYLKLFSAFPQFRKTFKTDAEILDMPALAEALGCSRKIIYRWCKGAKMRSKQARKIVELSGDTLKFEDFLDHI